MAIAASKLGRLIQQHWASSDETLVHVLRDDDLVKSSASDGDLIATFERARQENAALLPQNRRFNSPNERVRVFLGPYLTPKGERWAVPLKSLREAD